MIVGDESLAISGYYTLYLIGMFGLYLTIRIKGGSVLWVVVPMVAIYSTLMILDAVVDLGNRAMGISTNPNLMAALLAFSVFFLRRRWKWLIPLALAAILCTGSYWAVGALVVCTAVGIYRKEIRVDRWVAISSSVIVILALLLVSLSGAFQSVWNMGKIEYMTSLIAEGKVEEAEHAAVGRLATYKNALREASIVGNGLYLTEYEIPWSEPVHNVPLMIFDEIGPIAAVAWLVTMGYTIRKSRKYRYPILAMFLISATGCYWFWTWTALGTYYWLSMGLVSNEVL